MNKTVNTILFIILATLTNITIMILVMGVLYIPFFLLFARTFSIAVNQIVFLLMFAGSVFATYFIYKKIIRELSRRIDFGKFFR